jgi:hypothetical protein
MCDGWISDKGNTKVNKKDRVVETKRLSEVE